MARQRVIHPSLWTSDSCSKLTIRQRLLFIGMFSTADDYGRGKASPATLKMLIFPIDNLTLEEVAADYQAIEASGMILSYKVDEKTYYCLPRWEVYQRQKHGRRSSSPIPEPPQKIKDLCYKCAPTARSLAPEEKRREEKYYKRTTSSQRVTRAAWVAKKHASAAQSIYRYFAEQYKDLYKIEYPDMPAACVKILKGVVKNTSPVAARKACELYWESIRKAQAAEWRGTEPPPVGQRPYPTVRAFAARLATDMAKHGNKYLPIIEQDRAELNAEFDASNRGGLFDGQSRA